MAQYKVLDGENVYILSNKLYGSVDYVGKLIIDNNITDLSINLAGTLIEYDETIKYSVVDTLTLKEKVKENELLSYVAGENQSVFDLCLNLIGDLEQIVSFAKNSTLGRLQGNTASQTFYYNKTNNPIVKYSEKNNYKFATGIDLENINQGGAYSSAYNNAFN